MVYRILIVDDEKIERNGIKFLLKNLNFQYEIAEAQNGQAAYDYIKEHEIDILLTDVKMPFMDGIELIGEVEKLNRSIRYVIFSGCSEFDYAKQAIRLGVSDYILKPVDPVEFNKTLNKVVADIENERMQAALKTKSLEYMNEHILYMLANGSSLEDVRAYNNEMIDLSFLDSFDKLMLIEFNTGFFGKAGSDFKEKVLADLPEIRAYLNLNPEQSVILVRSTDNISELADRIVSYVRTNYELGCYIAISDEFDSPDKMSIALEQAENLMESKFYHQNCHVFYDGMKNDCESIIQIDDDTLMKQMRQDIKMKDVSGLRNHFERFCSKYSNKTDFSQVYVKFLFSNLLKSINENLANIDEIELNKEIDVLYRANDFDSVKGVVSKSIDRFEVATSQNPQMVHREIEVVKQYIYDHYGEEIGVEQLADMVYMAPSYLSSVFKKETGQNLSKFIKAYRMEKAKDMLETTMIKIVDISIKCGYPNTSYFCSSFREYFGVSPQKYRETGEDIE